eukprot:1701762-Pyramimonas_sp.AAC.1
MSGARPLGVPNCEDTQSSVIGQLESLVRSLGGRWCKGSFVFLADASVEVPPHARVTRARAGEEFEAVGGATKEVKRIVNEGGAQRERRDCRERLRSNFLGFLVCLGFKAANTFQD